jgi:hypothetical protein
MIEFVGEGKEAQLYLTPRAGFNKVKTLQLDLIYGHQCPLCQNVILAFFKTPEEVRLWPYEETRVLSEVGKNKGELMKVVPNEKSKLGESCYRSDFYRTPDGQSAQKLILKNHIMRVSAIQDRGYNGENLWEVGERTCLLTGVFSTREDITIKDLCLLFKMLPAELEAYNIPKVSELIPDPLGVPNSTGPENRMFRWTPAVGSAPPVILTSREKVLAGYPFWLKEILKPFKKAVTPPKEQQ